MDLQKQFEEAMANSKNLTERPSNEVLLQLYSLYKQGQYTLAWQFPLFCLSKMPMHHAWLFSMPFMNSFWINRTQPANRGEYAALYTMAWSAAQTLGPLGGSQLAGHFGFKWLWFSAGAMCITVALLIRRLREKDA